MKQACTVGEEQTVEVVRNHAGGTGEGVAAFSEGRESVREWTLRLSSMEGRSLDNPKRGNPMLPSIGSQGPGRAGKDGTKVRRVARFTMKVVESGPIEGPSRARARERPRPRRAVVNANRTMTSIGSSPRGRHPVDVAAGRGPSSVATPKGASATHRCGDGQLRLHASVPRGEREEATPRGEADPVDPVNPYPSVASDRCGAERPRLRRRCDLAAPVATRYASRHPPAGDSGGCTEPSVNL
jgi:hypothetical protein